MGAGGSRSPIFFREATVDFSTSAGKVSVRSRGCTLSGQDFCEALAPRAAAHLLARYGHVPAQKLWVIQNVLDSAHVRQQGQGRLP